MRNGNLIAVLLCGACRIGEHIAEPPVDGSVENEVDAATADAAIDGPSNVFHGLHAIIGERPEVTGTCGSLDDRAEMQDRFDPPVHEQDVVAGWEFDTGADDYKDPSYGFSPNWPTSESGRFSVRFTGTIDLPAGNHCFSIDIGATGTGIIDGKNMCAQIYVGTGDAIAETGYQAATAGPAMGCVDLTGPAAFDIVFWYFNILEQAKLVVRVDGAPLSLTTLSTVVP